MLFFLYSQCICDLLEVIDVKQNETQVSKKRYSLLRDAEEQPSTIQQSDAETDARNVSSDREPASNQGNKQMNAKYD